MKEERDYKQYFNMQALLNYKKSFGKHNFDVLAGFQAENEKTNDVTAFRDGYPTDLIYVLDAGSKDNWSNEGTAAHWSLASVIGRVNYDYEGNIFCLQVSVRMVLLIFRKDIVGLLSLLYRLLGVLRENLLWKRLLIFLMI